MRKRQNRTLALLLFSSFVSSCHLATWPCHQKLAACPGTGKCGRNQREIKPLRPELRPFVPMHGDADNGQRQTNEPDNERVLHRLIRREPRGDISAGYSVHDPISERENPECVRHRLKPGRVNSARVQYNIGSQRQEDDGYHSSEDRAHAAKNVCRGSFAHDFFAAMRLLLRRPLVRFC